MNKVERVQVERMERALRMCGAVLEERAFVYPGIIEAARWTAKERRAYYALCEALGKWPTGVRR